MHRCLIILIVILTGGCANTPTLEPSNRRGELLKELHDPDGRVLVTAHRGCWKNAPENSIAAINACRGIGADIVEIDFRLTRDGQVVAWHDSTLERMANIAARIEDLKLKDIQSHALFDRDGKRGGKARTKEFAPTLSDVLDALSDEMLLIVDMKSDPELLAPKIAKILKEQNACEITMFALVAPAEDVERIAGPLLDCASYLPNLRGPMGKLSAVANSYSNLNPIAVAVRFDDWSYLYEGTDDVAAINARLWVNTLSPHHAAGMTDEDALSDPDALWGRLIEAGVNMIQTDEPAALIAYLNE